MKRVLLATLALGLAAGTASADPLALNGSDTLFDFTTTLLGPSKCNVSSSLLVYKGGGSGLGEDNMEAGSQQIAPMSRALKAPPKSIVGVSQGCKVGLDGLGIWVDDGDVNNCKTAAYDGFLDVTDANSDGVLTCPDCVDGPDADGVLDTYQFTDWRDVLRIIYGGQTEHKPLGACVDGAVSRSVIGTKNCNSDVRWSLVNNWQKIFEETTCNGADPDNCAQLRHAFRRDDASGTTDVFLETLGLPDRNVKVNGPPVRPFCNGAELEDDDPIRRVCAGNGTSGNPDGDEQVCNSVAASLLGPANNSTNNTTSEQGWHGGPTSNPGNADSADLGLVLPIVIPATGAYQDPNPCSFGPSGGSFKLAPMPSGAGTSAQQKCPDGRKPSGGNCAWPIRTVSGSPQWGCINKKRNVPGARTIANMDGRVYNLIARNADKTMQTVERVVTNALGNVITINVPVHHALYRIHQSSVMPGGNYTTAGTPTPWVAATIGCQELDATEQIGCLVGASPCSIGYAGLAADKANSRPLALRTPRTGTCTDDGVDNDGDGNVDEASPAEQCGAVLPTTTTIRRLAEPFGASCGAGHETTSHYDIRYPLSRTLYYNSRKGFATAGDTDPYHFANIDDTFGEQQLIKCACDRFYTDSIVNQFGFVTIDSLNPICNAPGNTDPACRAPIRTY
jgi:hypothetical protein